MTCLKFIEKYCELNKLKISKELNGPRLKQDRLIKIKLLCFILRFEFDRSFSEIQNILQIGRLSPINFYYQILGNEMYRHIAQEKYQEVLNASGDIQESK